MSIQNPFDSHVRCNQSETSPSGYPYRVDEGGTEAFTALEGLDNLEAVPYSTIGDPNSVSPLDDLAMIPDEFCPEADIEQAPHIEGPTVVSAGQTAIFTITNYSYNSQYTIASIGSGTVEQFSDKVYYHAPVQATIGGDGFSINDRPISITVEGIASLAIDTPSILIPQNSSIDIGPDPFIVSSAFISTGFPQTHASSDWEIRQRLPGGDVISLKYSSYNNAVNKTDWYPGLLEPSSTYYLRVRYRSHLGNVSEWSEICIFNTASTFAGSINYVSRPTIVSRTRTDYPYVDKPEIIQYADDKIDQEIVTTLQSTPYSYNGPTDNVTDVASLHELTTSEFSYGGVQQTHVSTLWEVSKSSNFDTLVLRTTDSFTFKNSLILRDLDDNQTYYVRCKHIGHLTGESLWSYTFSFSTGVAYTVETLSVGDGDSNKTLSDIDHPRVGYGASMVVNDARSILCVGDDDRFYNDGADIPYVGCVSVYHKENGEWVQNTTLRNSDYSAEQYFGRRLAMSSDGTILAVSAPNKLGGDGHRGYVYLYTYSGTTQSWSEIDILGDTGITGMEEFGHSLSLTGNGDRLAVTFKKTDLAVTTRGVIIYKLENGHWVYDYTINICEDDGFMEVVINHIGDKFYVVYNHSNDYLTSHTYEMREYREFPSNPMPDGWLDTTVYTRDYPADCQIDRITFDVSRDENIAAVGIIAYYDGTNNHTYRGDSNIYNGYVDIVTRSFLEDDIIPVTRWGYQTTIENNNRLYRDRFGSHVKLNQDGTALLISAEYTDVDTGELNRSSYVFYRTDRYWTQHYQFTMPVHELMGLGPTLNKEGTYIYYTNQTTFMVKEQSFNRFADQEHIGSTWQIATDIPYTEIQQQNARDGFIKTRYTTQELEPETKYYPRMRQIGRITGESPWSDLIEVNTKPIDVILGGELYIVHPLHEVVGYDPVRTDAYGYNFSTDMDISGNGEVLVVGAPGKSTPFNTNTGAAYVYRDFSMVDYNYTDIKILEGNKLNLTHLYSNGYNWSSVAVVGGIPYATVMGGDVYELSQDGRIFQPLNLPAKNWVASCGVGHDLYLAEQNGDIYKIENVNGIPIPMDVPNEQSPLSITALGTDLYISNQAYGDVSSKIWKQINGTGDFIELTKLQSSPQWSGIDVSSRYYTTYWSLEYLVIYACSWNGDIYKIDPLTGNLIPQNQPYRQWSSIKIILNDYQNGTYDVYATVYNGDIYKQTGGVGDFIALNQGNRKWTGIDYRKPNPTVTPTLMTYIYACEYDGYIYRQINGTGNFELLPNQTAAKKWIGLSKKSLPEATVIYACTEDEGIYVHGLGANNDPLIQVANSTGNWSCFTPFNPADRSTDIDFCAAIQNGDLYLKLTDTSFVTADKLRYLLSSQQPMNEEWSGLTKRYSIYGDMDLFACTSDGKILFSKDYNKFNLLTYGMLSYAGMDGIAAIDNELYIRTYLYHPSILSGLYKINPLNVGNCINLNISGDFSKSIKVGETIYLLNAWENAIYKINGTNAVFVFTTDNGIYRIFMYNGFLYGPDGSDSNTLYKMTEPDVFTPVQEPIFQNIGMIYDVAVVGSHTYVTTSSGRTSNGIPSSAIYKQFNSTGPLVKIDEHKYGEDWHYTDSQWREMAVLNDTLYVTNQTDRKLYSVTNCSRVLTPLNQTPNNWSGLTTHGSDVYASVYGGDIYKQANATGDFIAMGIGALNWSDISANDYGVCAVVYNGDIYKQTEDGLTFESINKGASDWQCVTSVFDQQYITNSSYSTPKKLTSTNVLSTIGGEVKVISALSSYGYDIFVAESLGDIYKVDASENDVTLTGVAVSIDSSGTMVFIGRPGRFIGGQPNVGSVDIYERVNGNWQKKQTVSPIIEENVALMNPPLKSTPSDAQYIYVFGTFNPANYIIYAAYENGKIFVQTYQTDGFQQLTGLNLPSRIPGVANDITGMTGLGSDLYVCLRNNDIYKRINHNGGFIPLNQTYRNWSGLTTLGQNIYASVRGGDIYMLVNGIFEPLNQTWREWAGITTIGNDIYAWVQVGDIYKQTNGVGDFIPLNQSPKDWYSVVGVGNDIYATDYDVLLYKQTNRVGDFQLVAPVKHWNGVDYFDWWLDVYNLNDQLCNAWTDENDIYRYFTISDYSEYAHMGYGSGLVVNSDNGLLAVGCRLQHGQVHIYRHINNQYVLEKIVSPDIDTYPTTNDRYGQLSRNIQFNDAGDRLFISAYGTTVEGQSFSGIVYIYDYVDSDWVESARLLPPVAQNGQNFGWCVDCNAVGDTLAVCCPGKIDENWYKTGTVYVYKLTDGWSLTDTLTETHPTDDYYFGTSISMNAAGTKMYIFVSNVQQKDDCITREYTYTDNAWTVTNTYRPSDHLGGTSDHNFDFYWENWILADKLDNRLLLGHALDDLYGHDYVGYIFGYK